MQYQLETLKNNLKTLFVHSPGSNAASVQIWFRAGSALEQTKEDEGISHFLEHMFFKGTSSRPGAKIAHEVESFGGDINAFTSFDYTCYYINPPSHELIKSVEILLDMVSNPEFKNEDLFPERDVVFEEFRRGMDSPSQTAFHKIQQAAFTGTYAHQILGHEQSIKNFSREQLISYRKKYYNLSNAMLLVAGDLSKKEEIIKEIEKFKLPDGNQSSFPKFELKKKPTIDLHHKDVRTATLTINIDAAPYLDSSSAAEDLAINCLGYGETSRFYKNLVIDQTLCNNASGSTMFMNDGGVHFLRVTFPIENLNKVLTKTYQVLTEVYAKGFEKEEIQRIKNQYIASKVYEKESIESYSFSLGHSFAQCGDIHAESDFINRIKATTLEEVNKSFREIFKNSLHLNLQTPKSADLKKCEKELASFLKKLEGLKKTKVAEAHNFKIKTTKHDPQVQLLQIKPGIKLFYRQNSMTPTFILHAYIKGGLTEETVKNNGIHHLLATNIGKGYGKVSYESLKSELEDKSSSINGFAGKNAYGLLMHGLSENFQELTEHFCGSLLIPNFLPKFIKHEQNIAIRALENQKEDPVKQCFHEAHQLIFDKHPYAFNILGNAKNLKAVKQATLLKLHKTNLKNKEILITYCGDKSLNEVLEQLKPMFDKLPSRKESKVKLKPYKSRTNVDKFVTFDREQTQIFHCIPAGGMTSKDNLYLKMLSSHLSGQSSELFVEVRDRQGLCYTAQPVHFTALEGGYFGIYMASGHDKTPAAIKAIKDILNKIRENGLPEEDFLRIKKMIRGQNLINVQTNEDYASIYSVAVLQGEGLDYWHDKNKEIEELKYADFQKQIKSILARKWNTVIVGRPHKATKEI